MIERHEDFRKTCGADAGGLVKGWEDEEMECDDCRSGIAGEREDEAGFSFAGVGLEGDCGEGGGFAGFHGDAAEVDCSA